MPISPVELPQDQRGPRRPIPFLEVAGSGPRPAPAGPRARPEESLQVLVVDDEPLVVGMVGALLESAGHRVTLCLEGQQALEAVQLRHFDVALVDLIMPRLDGWEVSRRINGIRPGVPIIMVTGWSMTVADGAGHGAVVRAVLRKPFGFGELAGAIIEATGSGARQQGTQDR